MEITMGGFTMYMLKHKDNGAMMKYFQAQQLSCDYDYSSGEYCFYDHNDYLAAVMML